MIAPKEAVYRGKSLVLLVFLAGAGDGDRTRVASLEG
jgi:hypothetical protein